MASLSIATASGGRHSSCCRTRRSISRQVTRIWPKFAEFNPKIAEQVEINAKYAVYLERQMADVAAFQRDEALLLPDDLDYAVVTGLSNEARQKLAAARPQTIGQAGRIDGMTPAALMLLVAHLRRGGRKRASAVISRDETERDHETRSYCRSRACSGAAKCFT